MPGRKTPLVTDEYYHVFNRGVNKQPIFFGTKTYKRCLEIIRYYKYKNNPLKYSKFIKLSHDKKSEIWIELEKEEQLLVEIISFCLMPNHFHLLLKQNTEGGIAKFMSNFQNSLSRYSNVKTERTGHLLQGRFQAVRIEDDEQLLHVNRYIHLNPYTGFIVKEFTDLSKYPWSSLPEFINQLDKTITNPKIILENFKTTDRYTSFLSDHAGYQKTLGQIKHLLFE